MTLKAQYIGILLFLVFSFGNISATVIKDKKGITRIFAPDYINVQYAGNLGLGSIGVGYNSENEKRNYGLSYGYLPSSVNNVEVHTISAKGAINFRKHRLSENAFLNGYVGTNLLYSITNNTYLKFPGHYPTNYYVSNALHFAPFLGVKYGNVQTKRKNLTRYFYIELGTLDSYLFNRIKYDRFKFIDCLNVCMGISVPMNKSND